MINAWSKIVQSYEEEKKETGAGKFMRKWHIQCMKSAVERRKANVMNGLENDVDHEVSEIRNIAFTESEKRFQRNF